MNRPNAMRSLWVAGLLALAAGCSTSPSLTPSFQPSPSLGTTPSPTGQAAPSATGRAGLDWTQVPSGQAWTMFDPWHVTAGPAGILAAGWVRGSDPVRLAAWWSPTGGTWTDVSPVAVGTPWSSCSLAIAMPDGFAILGDVGRPDGSSGSVTWTWDGGEASHWETHQAVPQWGPADATAIGDGWLVLGGTMPVGGAPSASWTTHDFITWLQAPLAPTGYPYASHLVTLADRTILAIGRLAAAPVDTTPRPVGDVALWHTTDARSWTRIPVGTAFADASLDAIAVRSDRLVAFGRRWPAELPPDAVPPAAFWWSDDGAAWHEASGPTDIGWVEDLHVLALEDRFVLLGSEGSSTRVISVSDDGRAWQRPEQRISFNGYVHDVAVAGDLLVAVGSVLDGEDEVGAVWVSPVVDR
jgi:hypothetical protein